MAQQGKRSPRIFLVGSDAGIDVGSLAAAVPDVAYIAKRAELVNRLFTGDTEVRPIRDLMGRKESRSTARHTCVMSPVDSCRRRSGGLATLRDRSAGTHSMVAFSAASAWHLINQQYRGVGRARRAGISQPSNAPGVQDGAAKIGVDMPQLSTVVEAGLPADVAGARPVTGVAA